jgi:acyl-CoA synthetase (AMP-forming)/AMP-acid ligase II
MPLSSNFLDRISDYVRAHAAERPEAEAMVLGERRITYQEFARDVDACAKALLAHGIKKGDRVATLSTPHPEFLVHFVAASSIGAIWLGLNPRYTIDEYRYVVSDAEPKLMFAPNRIGARDFSADLRTLIHENRCVERLIAIHDAAPAAGEQSYRDFIAAGAAITDTELAKAREGVEAGDPALIVYTSGSTGKPKGALLPHRGLVRCAHVQLGYWKPDPIRVLNFFPINHIGCVGDICAYTLVGGGTIVFMEQFDPLEQLRIVAKERITLWGGVPTTIQMSLALPAFESFDLSSIQLIAWSGAAAPRELAARLAKICPRLTNAYGMTETVGSVTFVSPCSDLDVLTETVGRPVPEYDVKVVDSDGSLVPVGGTGEICVRGDFIMTGYWRRPKETAEAIDRDGWLHTGDLATLLPDGNLKLVGRIREMFKSGGYNVYPLEVEVALERHSSVAMAAVVGVADALYGEVGHAYLLLNPGASADEAILLAHCRGLLANYKIPKSFFVLSDMPMLPIGKIDKQQLKHRSVGIVAAQASERRAGGNG